MMQIARESRCRRRARQAVCAAALLFATFVTAGPLGAEPFIARPFVHAQATAGDPAAAAPLAPPRRGVVRDRAATVRADALVRGDGVPVVGVGQRIDLSLFDDAAFSMSVKDVTRHATGGHTWSGTLDGVDHGYAVLAQQDGTVVGHVVMPGAVYRIGPAGDGRVVIEQLEPSLLRREAEPRLAAQLAGDAAMALGESFDTAGDSASQMDVMIVYTRAARAAAGGTNVIRAQANEAIASANQAYANNGLTQRVRLVFVSEVPHVEGLIDDDVDSLQQNPVVGWLRDASRADLVSMLIYKPTSPFCGIAYLMEVNSASFGPFAYSVVDRDCISGLTFEHELGHNMGAHHDTFVTVGEPPPLFPYSHGYVDAIGHFRTIMAYPDACPPDPPPCTRLPFFSTPGQMFNGRPMGNAATADNERTLSETANTVANFRQALVSPLTLTTAANKTAFVVGDTMLLSVGIDNPGVPNVTVDAYLGLMSLNGTALFFTALPVGAGTAIAGNILNVATYRPLATGVSLASAVTGTLPNFVTYQRTAGDSTGGLVLFFLLVKTGSLADGVINPQDVVAVSLTPFTFQ